MRRDIALLMKATGTYRFFSTIPNAKNKCLDIKEGSEVATAPLILYPNNKQDNQIFHICPAKNGYYAIVSAHSLMVLDVEKGIASNGTPVIQYPYHGGDNQLWKLEKLANGLYVIHSKLNNNMVLDVKKANTANGTSIIIYEYHNSPNQKFKLEKA